VSVRPLTLSTRHARVRALPCHLDSLVTEFYARHTVSDMPQMTIVALIGVIALAHGTQRHLAANSLLVPQDCREVAPAVSTWPTPSCSLQVSNVRFESPPLDAPLPSTLLKFDVSNQSAGGITDVELQVTIRERRAGIDGIAEATRPLVGPFIIRGNVTIDAGYTFNYNLLLRNLSADCECLAHVVVISAQPVQDAAWRSEGMRSRVPRPIALIRRGFNHAIVV
jgi:hypothetical protein